MRKTLTLALLLVSTTSCIHLESSANAMRVVHYGNAEVLVRCKRVTNYFLIPLWRQDETCAYYSAETNQWVQILDASGVIMGELGFHRGPVTYQDPNAKPR